VLSAAPYADEDRILRLLVPEDGRVGAFQRLGRRKPAGLDVGVRARVHLRGRAGGLDTLGEVDVEDARVHLRRSFLRLAYAQLGCELVAGFSREGHPEPKLFGLLETFLLLLDALEGDPTPAFLAAMELKVLTFAGLGPALDRCAICGQPVEPVMAFDAEGGGARHPGCGGGLELPAAQLAELETLRRTPLRELVDRPGGEGNEPLVAALVRAHLGRELGARALLSGLH